MIQVSDSVYMVLAHLATGQWAWLTVADGNVIALWDITDWYGPVSTLAKFLAALVGGLTGN